MLFSVYCTAVHYLNQNFQILGLPNDVIKKKSFLLYAVRSLVMGSLLVQGDFSQNLKMLQKYPPVDVHEILLKAANL